MPKPKIFLASDHAGFELKEHIKKYLQKAGYQVEDQGAYKYDAEDDYPKFMLKAVCRLENGQRRMVRSARQLKLLWKI